MFLIIAISHKRDLQSTPRELKYTLKPGLHISCKDHKHIVKNVYCKLYSFGLVSKSL